MNEGQQPEQGMTEEQMLAALVHQQAFLLSHSLPRAAPEQIVVALQEELAAQDGLAAVLNDVVDEAARQKNPIWGFRILRPDGKELTRTSVAKALDPSDPHYIQHVAIWANVQAMVTIPALRAVWRALGAKVEFFQMKAPSPILHP